jgi:hypothetical protein
VRKILFLGLIFVLAACNLTIPLGPSPYPQPKPPPENFPVGPQEHHSLEYRIQMDYKIPLVEAKAQVLPPVTAGSFSRSSDSVSWWNCMLNFANDFANNIDYYKRKWICTNNLLDLVNKSYTITANAEDPLFFYFRNQGLFFPDTKEGLTWALAFANNSAVFEAGYTAELPGFGVPISNEIANSNGKTHPGYQAIAAIIDHRYKYHGYTFVFFVKRMWRLDETTFLAVEPLNTCLDPYAEVCPDPYPDEPHTPWPEPKTTKLKIKRGIDQITNSK